LARLVLTDKMNHICGDTAALASRSPEWADLMACECDDIQSLAVRAARLLDAEQGKAGCAYKFCSFAADYGSDGYFVFDCGCCADRAPPALAAGDPDPHAATMVMMGCFYVGYVRRDH
jgi:hypothetical protein